MFSPLSITNNGLLSADHPRNQAPPPPERWTNSIKIEIILFERMVFPVETRQVHHPYSDQLSHYPLEIPCYTIHEAVITPLGPMPTLFMSILNDSKRN